MKKLKLFRILSLISVMMGSAIISTDALAEKVNKYEIVYPAELTLKILSGQDPYDDGVDYILPRVDAEQNIYKFISPEGFMVTPDDLIAILSDDPLINWILGDGSPYNLGEDYTVSVNSNSAPMRLEEDWNGVMWLKMKDEYYGTIVFSNDKTYVPEWAKHLSGIKTVTEGDDAVTRYIDLQGAETADPGKGVYIRVSGDKTEKVVF